MIANCYVVQCIIIASNSSMEVSRCVCQTVGHMVTPT